MVSSQSSNASANEAIDPRSTNIEILIDKSGSMLDPMGVGSEPTQSRNDFMKEWVQGLVSQCARMDDDGIGIGFFNHRFLFQDGVKDTSNFSSLYDSVDANGSTNMGAAVETRLEYWRGQKESDPSTKPLRLIVATDGQPTDRQRLTDAIRKTCEYLASKGYSDSDVGIQFLQIGNDSQATEFLTWLDNDLNVVIDGVDWDIVDTKGMDFLASNSAEDLIKASETD